ncbi:sphingosine kinase [Acrasis kona]|uniref:Sphingosine kinase n=1 Tax=Acrasis kona TaxID=1008807 RepID=A0AAW2YWM6_9EUKA
MNPTPYTATTDGHIITTEGVVLTSKPVFEQVNTTRPAVVEEVVYQEVATVHSTNPIIDSINEAAHKIKWNFIRRREWHKLRKKLKSEETVAHTEEDNTEVVYSGELIYLSQCVTCTLTKKKLIIGRFDSKAKIVLSLTKEIYSVRKSFHSPASFVVCALVNRESRAQFEFSTVVGKSSLEQQVDDWIGCINQGIYGLSAPRLSLPVRRVLIVLNPASGGMTGKQRFSEVVKPILDDALESGVLNYSVMYTDKNAHGTEYTKNASLHEWDVIAAGGGDGTLHDCLTGLMERSDWQVAIKKPLCPIPLGTSNGMATSLYGSKACLQRAAMALVRGFQCPMDVCTVIQSNGKRYYSFLTLMFGFLANVTHKTDALRKLQLGEKRNTVGAVKELLAMDTYKAKLSYVQFEGPKIEVDLHDAYNKTVQLPEHRQCRINHYSSLESTTTQQPVQYNNIELNTIPSMYSAMPLSTPTTLPVFSPTNVYSALSSPQEEYVNDDEDSQDGKHSHRKHRHRKMEEQPKSSEAELNKGPDCPLLSKYFPEAFSGEFKSGYVEPGTVELDPRNLEVKEVQDDFFAIQTLNVSHLGARYSFAPTAYVNSGYLDLLWVRKDNASRSDFINRFVSAKYLSSEEEKLYLDSMEVDKTCCLKLEPFDEGTFVSVDGEAVDYVTTFVEMHNGLANVIVI